LSRELVQGKIRDLEKKFGTSIPTTEYDRFRLSGKDLQFEKSNGQYVTTDQKIKTIEEVLPISVAVNTDLDMREFLGIDKALTRIKGELQNNAAKLVRREILSQNTKELASQFSRIRQTAEKI